MAIFNPINRGILENALDSTIGEIPSIIATVRSEPFKNRYMYNDANDFGLGYIFGRILTRFETIYRFMYKKEMSKEEIDELHRIIYERMPKIRERIFQTG